MSGGAIVTIATNRSECGDVGRGIAWMNGKQQDANRRSADEGSDGRSGNGLQADFMMKRLPEGHGVLHEKQAGALPI